MSTVLAPTGETRDDLAKGWLVLSAWEASPASAAGIEAGWRLMAVDGVVPSETGLFLAMRDGRKRLEFADTDGRIWAWTAPQYPFGLKLSPPVDAAFRRALFDTNRNREAVIDLFEDGTLSNFAAFDDDFLKVLGAPGGWLARLGLKSAPKAEVVPPSDDHEMLTFLALSYVANAKFDVARAAADAAEAARLRVGQASYSANIHAIDGYVMACVAEAENIPTEAVQHIRAAAEMKPENTLIREAFVRIVGS